MLATRHMAGELEAAGTIVEGALLGAAVESSDGQTRLDENGESDSVCLNCGARLAGPFCAACGQKAHVHRTLSAIGHDVLHSVFHFDGKLWRTLPLLLFRPGELTRRYVHGERAKFVSPMALFLFTIFLMFAVFSFSGGGSSSVGGNWQTQMVKEGAELDQKIIEAEAQLKAAAHNPAEIQKVTEELRELKSERNGIAFATTGKPIYDDVGGEVAVNDNVSMEAYKSDTGWKWLDDRLNKGGSKMLQNPGLALYKLQSNGYKFAWLLIPLSLPFVWLVTLGVRGHRFYDHAVFTTYSISFMCLLFVVASVAGWLGIAEGLLAAAFAVAPAAHLYKQLRHAYGLSRAGTVLRMVPLTISIVFVLTLFFTILLMLGIMG